MPVPVVVNRLKFVNCYLVDEDDGLTLVDTMIPNSLKPIAAEAEQLGKPIVRIALTHGHGDHMGSLDDFTKPSPTPRSRSARATRACSIRTSRSTRASRR